MEGIERIMIRDLVIENRSYRSFDESKKIGREGLMDLADTARLCASAPSPSIRSSWSCPAATR